MNRTVLRSTRVLCLGGIRPADVVIRHDLIEEVAAYGSMAHAIDVGRRLVAPGFIDLHSDAVEKEIEPRPGAAFPIESAVVELDKKLAMAGITTMFHAIAFNDESLSGQRATAHSAALIRAIHRSNQRAIAGVQALSNSLHEHQTIQRCHARNRNESDCSRHRERHAANEQSENAADQC